MSKKNNLRAKKMMKRFWKYYVNRDKQKMEHVYAIVSGFIKI